MDVLEPKYLAEQFRFLLKTLQLGENPIRLVGTGSMSSQYYPADFDFLCNVEQKYTPQQLNDDFQKVLNRIDNKNKLFFIEFKLQQKAPKGKDPVKHKVFNMKDINTDFFIANFNRNTELCKIDAIIFYDGVFKEVSCIYFFGKKEDLDMRVYIKALLDDQKHYFEEGKIYKSLKRLMLSAKYESPPDKNLIIAITRFFNSMVGKLYELDNIIQAGLIYMKKFGVDSKMKMFIRNIGFGNMEPSKLEELSKDYQKLINGEALKLYHLYALPIGNLPEWNSIKPKINQE